ncbi:hypothetical protein PENTCL1PPCAC_7732, partial [Pristionchus entomophagus]
IFLFIVLDIIFNILFNTIILGGEAIHYAHHDKTDDDLFELILNILCVIIAAPIIIFRCVTFWNLANFIKDRTNSQNSFGWNGSTYTAASPAALGAPPSEAPPSYTEKYNV